MFFPKAFYFTFLFVLMWFCALFKVSDSTDLYHDAVYRNDYLSLLEKSMPIGIAQNKTSPPKERDTDFWFSKAQRHVQNRIKESFNRHQVKNIILFLGDGMSVTTLTAARILKGQQHGGLGEDELLTMDQFSYVGLSKTYCTNGQTADSACSGTAYLCGVKTNLMNLGVNARVEMNNCSSASKLVNQVDSIALWAQKAGKSTGIVTTTRVTHASPAASYAHVPNRNFECDSDILDATNKELCQDIAKQLILNEPGKNFNVIMGGGLSKFLPHNKVDAFKEKGERNDGLDLENLWQLNHPDGAIVHDIKELANVNVESTQHLLGLFHSSHMDYYARVKGKKNVTQPRLKEMTASAIKILEKNPNGYFLFIEGGRIDHGHHETIAGLALEETLEFDEAINTALTMTNEKETLIVVTADHSHSTTMSGYPGRGNPILGLNQYDRDIYGVPYNVLNYALGPKQYVGYKCKRKDLTNVYTDFMHTPSYIKQNYGVHAGEDVVLLANGPQANLFSGVMEQNVIPHLMAYAACIGKGLRLCDTPQG